MCGDSGEPVILQSTPTNDEVEHDSQTDRIVGIFAGTDAFGDLYSSDVK